MKKRLAAITTVALIAIAATDIMARSYDRGRGCDDCYNRTEGNNRQFRGLERMQYRLKLTDKQVEKIFTINGNFREKYFKNRKNADKIDSLREEHRLEIEKILNSEQKKLFKEWGRGEGCQYYSEGRRGRR